MAHVERENGYKVTYWRKEGNETLTADDGGDWTHMSFETYGTFPQQMVFTNSETDRQAAATLRRFLDKVYTSAQHDTKEELRRWLGVSR